MAERRPLVIVGKEVTELPAGDTLPGGGGGGGASGVFDCGGATAPPPGTAVIDFGKAS